MDNWCGVSRYFMRKQAFSTFLRRLQAWHCPHLLMRAVLRPRTAAPPTVQQSIDIHYPPGPQQQTQRTLLQRANGTDRETDSVPLQRPCSAWAYYADCANKCPYK